MNATTRSAPIWLSHLRQLALERIKNTPWPTKKDEEWRRTLMSRLPWENFQEHQNHYSIKQGSPDPSYSAVVLIQDDGSVSFWSSTSHVQLRYVQDYDQAFWNDLSNFHEDRFFWEHLATNEEALVIEIQKGATLDRPILVHWNRRGLAQLRSAFRLQVLAQEASVSSLILRLDSRVPVFLNSLLNIWVENDAVFQMTQIQSLSSDSYWVEHSLAHQKRGSVFHHTLLNLGADTTKTKFTDSILGDHAEFQAKGIYICTGKQHKDMRLVQQHRAPESLSNALYKGAVKDKGRSIFQGLIEVSKEGRKTDAYLSNKNLVLNDGARADSLPQLKIDHNDLRCTHGSTTGMVDQEQVHYLQSRGLNPKEAKTLITMGLFQEIIDTLPESLRLPVEGQVEQLLKHDDEPF